MTIKGNVVGAGISPSAATAILGGVNSDTAGAGTVSTDAALLPLVSIHNIRTAASNSGVILPPGNGTGAAMQPGDEMWIYNGTANTFLLYPPALGQLNDGTATSGTVSCPTHTTLVVKCLTATLFAVSGPTT